MKFKLFNMFAVCALAMIVSTNARARECEAVNPESSYIYANEAADHAGCSTVKDSTYARYYKLQNGDYIKVTDCTACESGEDPIEKTTGSMTMNGGVTCEIHYFGCKSECPANCEDEPDWQDYTASHQRGLKGTCSGSRCEYGYVYRCNKDYYGTASGGTSSTSGCTKCDVLGGVQSTSTAGENSYHSSCCFDNDDIITDGDGNKYHFKNKCCWSMSPDFELEP